MCLIGFHINDHPTYKLIVAANRDEVYKRPTKKANFWQDHPTVLAGRDLVQMGTWLGMTRCGRFAALTNYRKLEDHDDTKRSRGEIPTNFLQSTIDARTYLENLRNNRKKYNGFNTVVGTIDNLYYYGNYQTEIIRLEKGTHALSNHLLNTPWPKVTQIKLLLKQYVQKNDIIQPDDLFNILKTDDIAQDEKLPDTGVGLDLERKLSPIFIKMNEYGTRSSTVILVTHRHEVQFVERTYNTNGKKEEDVEYTFKIKSN